MILRPRYRYYIDFDSEIDVLTLTQGLSTDQYDVSPAYQNSGSDDPDDEVVGWYVYTNVLIIRYSPDYLDVINV